MVSIVIDVVELVEGGVGGGGGGSAALKQGCRVLNAACYCVIHSIKGNILAHVQDNIYH